MPSVAGSGKALMPNALTQSAKEVLLPRVHLSSKKVSVKFCLSVTVVLEIFAAFVKS